VVALAIRPGTSVSRLARQLDINANQLSRWIREQSQAGLRRTAIKAIMPSESAFVPVEIRTPEPTTTGSTLSIQVRMPNGVAVEFVGCELAQAGQLIEALGRLRCSGSTKP
jgi:transposase